MWLNIFFTTVKVRATKNLFTDANQCNASIPLYEENNNCKNKPGSYRCSCKTGFSEDE